MKIARMTIRLLFAALALAGMAQDSRGVRSDWRTPPS